MKNIFKTLSLSKQGFHTLSAKSKSVGNSKYVTKNAFNSFQPSFFGQFNRSLFIQTETTPNPSSLKFIPGETVLPKEFGSTMSFRKSDNISHSPLAKRLFRINGVESVMFGELFISIVKNDTIQWSQLKPDVFSCLMDFFDSEKPAVLAKKVDENGNENENEEEDSEVVELIKELLDERIRPMVQEDGGDIFFISFDENTGVVVVRLAGACEGCPSSMVTLKSGVENMLMHYLPEVKRVDQFVEDDEINERTLTWTPST